MTIPIQCNALILKEKDALNNFYKIVKIDHLDRDSIIMDVEGCVTRFKVNNPVDEKNHDKTFILLNREDLNATDESHKQNDLPTGFYEESVFYKYHQESHDYFVGENMHDLIVSRYTDFIEATPGDTIYVVQMVIEKEANGDYGCFPARNYYKTQACILNYDGELLSDDEFGVPDIFIYSGSVSSTNYSSAQDTDTDVLFYESNIYQANIEGLSEFERYQVAKAIILIAVNIHNIKKDVFPLLPPGDMLISLLISQQISYWQTINFGIFDGAKPEDILRYNRKINLFYNQAEADKLVIDQETGIRALWRLLGCLDSESMATFSITLRIEFLWIIMGLKKLDDPVFSWEPVDMESVVRDIIWSVDESDANTFLKALLEQPDKGSNMTIFQYIFDETNDSGFTPNALRDILDHLCYLWLYSEFAYYENGIPPHSFDDNSSIGEVLLFMNIDPTQYNESTVTPAAYSNKALVLNYKSEEFLWFFHDTSHDFVMNGENIIVFKDAPKSSAFPYEYKKTKVYHMFQGVSVAMNDNESSDELRLKFQQFSVNGQASAIVPIFYLAYIDYNKTVENYTKAVEIAIDLAFTVTGIGNILKLRHLFKLTKLGRMALTGETVAETVFVQLAKATFEIAPTVAQYYVEFQMTGHENYCDINSPNYDPGKCNWYRQFSQFLMLIQIKAGVIEGAHQLMIRRSARRLIDDIAHKPDNFGASALNTLQSFAYTLEDLEDSWKETLYQALGTYDSNVWQKYSTFSTDEKKIALILDFEDASHVSLNILNKNGGDLIDYWDEISYLTKYRAGVEFLDGYKRVKNSERLNMEIFEGNVDVKPVTKPGAQPGQKRYNVVGIHYKSALTTAFPPGRARLTGDLKYHTVTSSNGEVYSYYKSKVEMFDETYYNQFGGDGFKVKDSPSTFFPDEWDSQRVIEEVALAYAQKFQVDSKLLQNGKLFKGRMSDGTFCAFQIEMIENTEGILVEGIIESAYPSIKFK